MMNEVGFILNPCFSHLLVWKLNKMGKILVAKSYFTCQAAVISRKILREERRVYVALVVRFLLARPYNSHAFDMHSRGLNATSSGSPSIPVNASFLESHEQLRECELRAFAERVPLPFARGMRPPFCSWAWTKRAGLPTGWRIGSGELTIAYRS